MHNVEHNHLLHTRNVILHVVTDDLPRVAGGRTRHGSARRAIRPPAPCSVS